MGWALAEQSFLSLAEPGLCAEGKRRPFHSVLCSSPLSSRMEGGTTGGREPGADAWRLPRQKELGLAPGQWWGRRREREGTKAHGMLLGLVLENGDGRGPWAEGGEAAFGPAQASAVPGADGMVGTPRPRAGPCRHGQLSAPSLRRPSGLLHASPSAQEALACPPVI